MSGFDFRAAQQRARRASALLVLGFTVLVVVIGGALGLLASVLLHMRGGDETLTFSLHLPTVLVTAGLIIGAISLVALIRVATLGGDGATVARALGGEEVTEQATNPYQRRYLNVVQEMAIAAGLPPPRAFVVRNEAGINAFAAGGDPSRAAIGVTHGALARLNRAELSGVIGHEMAHIAHYDTRLNTRLMGMVFGLVILHWIGRSMLRASRFRGGGRGGGKGMALIAVLAISLFILSLVGVLAGRILQSAVSRRRESLADAGGVQFTRNPQGLAQALKKIGASSAGSRMANPHAEEARHMFFAEAAGGFAGLFATHPPLLARIRALEPDFDPERDPVWRMDDRAMLKDARLALRSPSLIPDSGAD
ncbi:MAG: M48 family metallopeptidase [Alphaproteobacteria bacterium]